MSYTRRQFVTGTAAVAFVPAYARQGKGSHEEAYVLRYDSPAKEWTECLPLGNGRLGVMVRGCDGQSNPAGERLQLNEETLWSGYPRDGDNPDALPYLQQVRDAVLKRKDYHAADKLCQKMQGHFGEAFQPAGDLVVEWIDANRPTSSYTRRLDLDTAIHTVTHQQGSMRVSRETFASAADQVIVHTIAWKGDSAVSLRIRLSSPSQKRIDVVDERTLLLTGKVPAHVQAAGERRLNQPPVVHSDVLGEGMYFAIAVRVVGGTIQREGDSLRVENLTGNVMLVADIATGYRGFDQSPNVSAAQLQSRVQASTRTAADKGWKVLRSRHVADYQPLFRRVSLRLGTPSDETADAQRSHFASQANPSILALYFQYGRYLLLSSSRPGGQPANLQGIWSEDLRPPWSSNWTSNINIQMNYWPAETCNLSECTEPLFRLIRELSINGSRTAKAHYGAPGWVAHHNIDLWKISNPVGEGVGEPKWANWNMSGAWLCQHLFEQYRFTGDTDFLAKTAYPLMRSAAEFYLAILIPDEQGRLTTCPSESTENDFLAPDGKPAMTSAGCTMDMVLMRELFANCVASAKLLGVDAAFSQRLQQASSKLIPLQIGRWGQLQEWSVDFEESTPGQRHMSHMYPLYPGDAITPEDTPELARAARISLERRLSHGGAYTGWSRAWAIGFWARLQDGDQAWESLCMLMQHSTNASLLDTHPGNPKPIFQIDGNFGATAAIAEMLLQSHRNDIHLLPALPSAWGDGEVRGLVARGGFHVSIQWKNGGMQKARIVARQSGVRRVRYGKSSREIRFVRGQAVVLDGALQKTPSTQFT